MIVDANCISLSAGGWGPGGGSVINVRKETVREGNHNICLTVELRKFVVIRRGHFTGSSGGKQFFVPLLSQQACQAKTS